MNFKIAELPAGISGNVTLITALFAFFVLGFPKNMSSGLSIEIF